MLRCRCIEDILQAIVTRSAPNGKACSTKMRFHDGSIRYAPY